MVVCASPEYAREHGLPRHVEELENHRCINFRTSAGRIADWEFKVDGFTHKRSPAARQTFNDIDLMLQAVLDGQGIAQLPAYLVCDSLKAGRLVVCLAQHAPDDGGHYLCYLSRKQLPKRIRAFVDFMTARVRALDLDPSTIARRDASTLPGAAA
jgi:DNA-binding transcriptional LysR family regulator